MSEATRLGEGERKVCRCAPDCDERIACTETGMGHWFCGWCEIHETARHNCGCPHTSPAQSGGDDR